MKQTLANNLSKCWNGLWVMVVIGLWVVVVVVLWVVAVLWVCLGCVVVGWFYKCIYCLHFLFFIFVCILLCFSIWLLYELIN